MDSETKTLLLVMAAVAGGAVLGWCIKQNLRMPRAVLSARKAAPSDDVGLPVLGTSNAGGSCGCRS